MMGYDSLTAPARELEARVDTFIDDLVAQDVNSPEFGRRVEEIIGKNARATEDAAVAAR